MTFALHHVQYVQLQLPVSINVFKMHVILLGFQLHTEK